MEQQPGQYQADVGSAVKPPNPQDGALVEQAAPSQSAISAYDRMLQDKERRILEEIARKRSKIAAVERQLAELQLALHVNVGPRRQALEHIRSLIEQQNHIVDTARANFQKARAEMVKWETQMQEAQQRKNQLAQELNTLVQQSAGAQLQKLEQLSAELEHLQGLPTDSAAAANGMQHGASSSQAAGARVPAQQLATEAEQQQHAFQTEYPDGIEPKSEQRQQKQEQEQQNEQQQESVQRRQQQLQAATAARGRHVQISGRKASAGRAVVARGGASQNSQNRPAAGFQGFD